MANGTILIVDDEAENLNLLGTILDGEGYDLYCMSSSEEALHFVREYGQMLDVILVDIMMPNLDGYGLCEALKNEPSSQHIPIIFISALRDEKSVIRGIQLGAVDFISKPFSSAILKLKVFNAIRLHQFSYKMELLVEEEKNKNRLNEAILVQQSKLASMGQMMENIAHQWRQPLNTLGLMIQVLPDDFDDGHVDAQYVENLVKKTKDKINFMSKTIDDFRNFFRSNKEKTTFDGVGVFSKIFTIMEAQFKKHAIYLSLECGVNERSVLTHFENGNISYEEQLKQHDLPKIEMFNYENELQQVLINIFSNAVYALITKESGQKRIYVVLGEDAEMIKIEILDNAGGIQEEVLPRIFEPYFTTKGHEGTGVGLYMSKVIIENNMGGVIDAYNSIEGAVFRIRFYKRENRGGGRLTLSHSLYK